MPTHNSVPTTCTASLMTNWDIPNINNKDEKVRLKAQIKAIKDMVALGYKNDFAVLHAFTTQNQIINNGLEQFMPLIGFKPVFRGVKSNDKIKQRHQETGDITLWATDPKTYQESIESSLETLQKRLDIIDPPKYPDPERQKWPEIKGLAKAGLIHSNANKRNTLSSVLKVAPTAAAMYIRTHHGIDFRVWQDKGDAWINMTIEQLRREHDKWKAELI